MLPFPNSNDLNSHDHVLYILKTDSNCQIILFKDLLPNKMISEHILS